MSWGKTTRKQKTLVRIIANVNMSVFIEVSLYGMPVSSFILEVGW